MKTFLKPLTAEEERVFLKRSQDGDLDARHVLIERNLRLVAHVIKKYQNTDEEQGDLIATGTIGLIKAISTFDVNKSSRLSTYAARCIDNELLMLLRSKKKRSKEVSLYEPIGTDKEGNEINLLDILESPPVDVVEDCLVQERIKLLRERMDQVLSAREARIIRLRYGLGRDKELTQREVAQRMGISRSYVSRIEKNALAKLRRLFPGG